MHKVICNTCLLAVKLPCVADGLVHHGFGVFAKRSLSGMLFQVFRTSSAQGQAYRPNTVYMETWVWRLRVSPVEIERAREREVALEDALQ